MEIVCDGFRQQMPEYIAGLLPVEKVDVLAEHIKTCPACGKYLYQLKSDANLLAEFAQAMNPAINRIKNNVIKSLTGKRTNKFTKNISKWRLIMKTTIAKIAVAAVILLVVGIGIAVQAISNDNETELIAEEVIITENATEVEIGKTQLDAELEKLDMLFAAGDVKGLVSVLADDKYAYETKMAAANFLAEIGDDTAIEELENLSDQFNTADIANPFANAIDSIESRTETAVTENMQIPLVINSDANNYQLLKLLPAESLFCLKVNNFDSALGMIDQYIAGISPIPVGLSMVARMQLAGIVGDPALNNINTQGNFAIFGVGLPHPTGKKNMVIAALLPITDYEKLLAENPNYTPPDANGISIVKVGGSMAPNKTKLATRVGNYILISLTANYNDLVALAKLTVQAPGLDTSLDSDETAVATTKPIWAYGNIQQVSKVLGPVLVQGLEQMKTQIEKMNEAGQAGPPATVMNFYFGMLDVILEEIKFFSIAITPQADVLNMKISMAAVPETLMAKMFSTTIPDSTENKLLGYLQNDAIFNIAIRKNTAFWEECSLSQFDIMSFFSEEALDYETVAKLEKTISELIAVAGSSGVVSVKLNDQPDQMPIAVRYIYEVKDPNRWDAAIEDVADIWNKTSKSLAMMGIESKYEIEWAVDTYKDVSIDAAMCTMKATDPNTDYGSMLDQIYKGGMNYKFAEIDGVWFSVLGSDTDAEIRKLIDIVKAGGPTEITAEFKTAMESMTEPDNADFAGTINMVRYMSMAGKMAQATELTPSGGFIMPNINVPSNSNMAFTGKVGNNKIIFQAALPKTHLLEIKTAGQRIAQEMAATRQKAAATAEIAAAEKAAAEAKDANTTEDVNDVNE